MTNCTIRSTALLATLVAAASLAACGRSDDNRTAGEKLDSAIATAREEGAQARSEASDKMAEARQEAREATSDLRRDGRAATDAATSAVNDAAITAGINAELAKDARLSAIKIDVDTKGGHVALKGTAPDAASRERATQLAAGVKGVSSVDNQLVVDGRG